MAMMSLELDKKHILSKEVNTMKIYNVKYLTHGRPHTIRIEGARNIPDAVQAAEAVLNTVYKLDADIYGVFEVYK